MIKPIEHFSLWTVVIFEKPEAIVEIDWDQAEYEYIPAEEAEYVRD